MQIEAAALAWAEQGREGAASFLLQAAAQSKSTAMPTTIGLQRPKGGRTFRKLSSQANDDGALTLHLDAMASKSVKDRMLAILTEECAL